MTRLGSSIPHTLFGITLMVFMCFPSHGQDYPTKPIRLFTSPPGGGNDYASRVIAQQLNKALGQPVIVENRAGVIPGETVAKASPDGYTMLLAAGNLWITPLLQKTPYDALRDFSAVTWATNSPNILVTHPSLPPRTVKQLIEFARARPAELTYASSSLGASAHLSAELFKVLAKVNILHVPYKGSGQSIVALIGGQVDLSFPPAGAVMPHVKANKLIALAVTSSKRSESVPHLPTVQEAGLPGYSYDTGGATTIFVPARTPSSVIQRLNREIIAVLRNEDVRQKLFNAGMEIVGSTPHELAEAIKSDIVKWSKVFNEIGIHNPGK